MPVGFGLYTVGVAFLTAVALALVFYGGLDVRLGDTVTGLIEAGAGLLVTLYLLAFQLEGLTNSLVRALMESSLTGRMYILGAMAGGIIITDYLLRRLIPLIDAGVRRLLARVRRRDPGEINPNGTRRTVMGVGVGLAAAGLTGGFAMLDGVLRSQASTADAGASFRETSTFEAPYFPTAMSFTQDGDGYVSSLNGGIYRFERPDGTQEALSFRQVASGIRSPQGIEVHEETLYTVDNGTAASGKYGLEEGYEVLQDSNGSVLAFDIEADGSLTNRRTILSGLPVVNSDHALHQVETGPDGRLYLSIGHLGGKKYPEMFDGQTYEPTETDHPNYEYLGTVIAFDPDGSNVEIVASGLRNVYDITFDQSGHLYGANNDGMSMRSKVWESIMHISPGDDFGYPEYGTFDAAPGEADPAEPLWVLEGVQSTGVETTDNLDTDDGIVVALADRIAYVPLEAGPNGVYVPEFLRPEPTVIDPNGTPLVVEADPDGRLWIGCVGRDDTFTLYEPVE